MSRPPWVMPSYKHLEVRYDEEHAALWYLMCPTPRPCFSLELLAEIRDCHRRLAHWTVSAPDPSSSPMVRFMVGASLVPDCFNLGGDLALFSKLIEARDAAGLRRYALECVKLVHLNATNLQVSIPTISLVQGDAFGGGMEAAISCNIVVAENRARFGLPEVLFNLFPGMGAYQLLARRVGPAQAERFILSGKTFSAQECYEMGIVDILATDGAGPEAVRRYIREHTRRHNAFDGVMQVREALSPVTLEGLEKVVEVWVRSAMRLEARDLRLMRRLARSQERLARPAETEPPTAEVIPLR
ncbi:MAG: crotonase/enoyl-CoA hydratase family protein [Deferrisomatales bacterium]